MNISPSIKTSMTHIIAIFKNSENIPKVTILSGSVRISRIGLTAKLIVPRTNPAKANVEISPIKETPGIPVASHIPRIPTAIWVKKLFIPMKPF